MVAETAVRETSDEVGAYQRDFLFSVSVISERKFANRKLLSIGSSTYTAGVPTLLPPSVCLQILRLSEFPPKYGKSDAKRCRLD